jgi:hypothetical protein
MPWILIIVLIALVDSGHAVARNNGQYSGSPLHEWFENLRSARGVCCSDADGVFLEEPNWMVQDGRYRVRLSGIWVSVPDDALVAGPNRVGRAMVWVYEGYPRAIRCFMPGAQV